MGAVFALRRAMGIDVRQLLVVLAINLALPFFVGGIAWQGHIGGLVIGFLIGTDLRADPAPGGAHDADPRHRRRSPWGCCCCSPRT